MPEPYSKEIVSRELNCFKNSVRARVVGVLGNTAQGRGMKLIPMPSRVVRAGDVHELISTIEAAHPSSRVEAVGYLAWVAFDEPGVLVAGDIASVEGTRLGEICGFDETHAPNHINIVIRTCELLTGRTANLQPDTRVTFSGKSREALGW